MRTIILFFCVSLAATQVRSQQYAYLTFDSIHLRNLNILTGSSAFVADIQATQKYTSTYNGVVLRYEYDTLNGFIPPNTSLTQADEPIYYLNAPSDTNQLTIAIQPNGYIAAPIGSTSDTLRAVVTFSDGNGRTVSFYGPRVIPKLNTVNNIPIPPCLKAYTAPPLPLIPITSVPNNPTPAYLNNFKIVTITLTN